MTQQTPHIYVVCIAAYNNGKLHGTWIDCDRDADSIWAEVQKMLASSPEPSAEEWAIHDFENWQGIKIDEHEAVNRIAELAQLLTEHGKPFGAYCSYYGNDITVETFSSSYLGMYKDEEDFVYQRFEQQGILTRLLKLGIQDTYLDWEAIARDWFINSYLSIEVGCSEVYVFNRR